MSSSTGQTVRRLTVLLLISLATQACRSETDAPAPATKTTGPQAPAKTPAAKHQDTRANATVAPRLPSTPPVEATPDARPQLAIVIDDVGLRRDVLDPFLAIRGLRGVVTWAIIPRSAHAAVLARELIVLHEPIMVHMPMEPANPANIAPHLGEYLRRHHTPRDVRERLAAAFASFPSDVRPHLRGVNNHQGSGLTASRPHMAAVVALMAARSGFVLDSRTTKDSVLEQMARQAGLKTQRRDVFLDNVRRPEAIVDQLNLAVDRAVADGTAVAIGHPYPETAQALATWLRGRGQHVRLVPVETILE